MITIDRPFVLIRHGQTDASRGGSLMGRREAQLTDAGTSAAEALAALPWEGPLYVFASPQKPTHQTAALAFPEEEILLHEGLRAQSCGDPEGQPMPGGESGSDLQARVAATISDCLARSPKHHLTVLVVPSGILCAARAVTGGDPGGAAPAHAVPRLFSPLGGGKFRESGIFSSPPVSGGYAKV
ncbi:histidine phosphatase family protein [Falsigemmobacter faecalis]|uniref:Histidine phosphatase family protein n=1 Tax=Falsigemmobacter faecalis TaxID=2488730 RepID=A0A3P3DZG8_9RHOB|nr:histidine phosphatase family protein [Falsigemmobacter faecalis]RRH78248.1 histidine phosphatase family protein [Falsigemmobacter faecalis]